MATNEIISKLTELAELRKMADDLNAEIEAIQNEIKAHMTAEDTDTQDSRAYNKSQYITGAGVVNGKVVFAPKANATRAQVATMLYRYMTGERIKAE